MVLEEFLRHRPSGVEIIAEGESNELLIALADVGTIGPEDHISHDTNECDGVDDSSPDEILCDAEGVVGLCPTQNHHVRSWWGCNSCLQRADLTLHQAPSNTRKIVSEACQSW